MRVTQPHCLRLKKIKKIKIYQSYEEKKRRNKFSSPRWKYPINILKIETQMLLSRKEGKKDMEDSKKARS